MTPTFSYLAINGRPGAGTAAASLLKRHGLGRARDAGSELLERGAEIHRVGGELLQRLLRVQALERITAPEGIGERSRLPGDLLAVIVTDVRAVSRAFIALTQGTTISGAKAIEAAAAVGAMVPSSRSPGPRAE